MKQLILFLGILALPVFAGAQGNSHDIVNILDPASCRSYRIADYTRFHTLQEVITEFVKELRWREGRMEILCTDDDGMTYHFSKAGLFLVDGVPVENEETVIDLDPDSLEEIRVYPDCYLLDGKRFDGIVNFIRIPAEQGRLPR